MRVKLAPVTVRSTRGEIAPLESRAENTMLLSLPFFSELAAEYHARHYCSLASRLSSVNSARRILSPLERCARNRFYEDGGLAFGHDASGRLESRIDLLGLHRSSVHFGTGRARPLFPMQPG